jgi:hypothetical protein
MGENQKSKQAKAQAARSRNGPVKPSVRTVRIGGWDLQEPPIEAAAALEYVLPDDHRFLSINDALIQRCGGLMACLYLMSRKFDHFRPPAGFGDAVSGAANPVSCLAVAYRHGCLTEDEMRTLLNLPVQFVAAHRRYFDPNTSHEKRARFTFEFADFMRLFLRLAGATVTPKAASFEAGAVNMLGRFHRDGWTQSLDLMAGKYERLLSDNGAFQAEAQALRLGSDITRWAFSAESGWLAAFDAEGRFDEALCQVLEQYAPSGASGVIAIGREGVVSERRGDGSTARDRASEFCRRWKLARIGVPFGRGAPETGLEFEAQRMRLDETQDGMTRVAIPRYYEFPTISRLGRADFSRLADALARRADDVHPKLDGMALKRGPKRQALAKMTDWAKFLRNTVRARLLKDEAADRLEKLREAEPSTLPAVLLRRKEQKHRADAFRKANLQAYKVCRVILGRGEGTLRKWGVKCPASMAGRDEHWPLRPSDRSGPTCDWPSLQDAVKETDGSIGHSPDRDAMRKWRLIKRELAVYRRLAGG